MKNIVIIGNSAAGVACVEALRKKDQSAKVTVVSDEDYPAYCRCLISYYLAGEVKEDRLLLRSPQFYSEHNVELFLNKKVERIDPKRNRLICLDKTQFNYDYLLIATGGRPKFPQLVGIKKRGVFGFRTIKDAKEIDASLLLAKAACVLGGGLIGLKAAYALKKRGTDVKVIVKSPQVLSQMLDFDSAKIVEKRLQEHGIEIVLGQDAVEIIGNGDIRAVKLDSGKAFECTLVIAAKGVAPNIEVAKDTQIQINEGIVVNNFLETSVPGVYAAGDVCESFDVSLGKPAINALWPIAVEQGKIAGLNMVGSQTLYEGSVGMNAIEFFGLPVVSLGVYRIQKEAPGVYEELKISLPQEQTYKKLILKDNFLIGAILVGDIKQSGILLRLMRERIPVTSFKERLLQENFSYPDIMHAVKEKERLYV